MPLNPIIYKSPIKRKALAAIRTICRYCNKMFLDKYYGELEHKVLCPHCGMVNAKVQFNDLEEILVMGVTHDIGILCGDGGAHLDLREIKKIFQKMYGKEEGEKKLNERLEEIARQFRRVNKSSQGKSRN